MDLLGWFHHINSYHCIGAAVQCNWAFSIVLAGEKNKVAASRPHRPTVSPEQSWSWWRPPLLAVRPVLRVEVRLLRFIDHSPTIVFLAPALLPFHCTFNAISYIEIHTIFWISVRVSLCLSVCLSVCPHLWHPSPSPFVSTKWCSRPYKPYIFWKLIIW